MTNELPPADMLKERLLQLRNIGINNVLLKPNGDIEIPSLCGINEHITDNSSNNDAHESKTTEKKPRRTREQLKELDDDIRRLKDEGKSREEIARECGISEVYLTKRLSYIFDPSNSND